MRRGGVDLRAASWVLPVGVSTVVGEGLGGASCYGASGLVLGWVRPEMEGAQLGSRDCL